MAIAVLGGALILSMIMRGQESKQFQPVSATVLEPIDTSATALLERASALHAERRYQEAIALYDEAARRLPQIADWIAVFAAASAAYRGDTLEVERRLARVDETLAREWGWRARVRALETAGAAPRALDLATAATKFGSAGSRADAWYRVAELQRDLGNRAAQKSALLQAIATSSGSGGARDAAIALLDLEGLSASERLTAARVLLSRGEITRAEREIERALTAGGTDDASQVRYDLGRALFNAGRYDDAREHLARVARGHARRPDARYLLARAQYRSGAVAAGVQTFRDVAEAYPKTSAATRSLYLLADLAQDDGRTAEARALFEKTMAAPARTDESALATMRLGALYYAQGDYPKAAAIFEQYRTRYPRGSNHQQATFWLAQVQLRRGNQASAHELLREVRSASPLSYYGLRAAAQLGGRALPEVRPGPAADSASRALVSPRLERWQLLREVGWHQAAGFELARLRGAIGGSSNAQYALAEELIARGAPHVGIETGRGLLGEDGWNERLLRILYPMPYRELIERESRANGLDPYFVAALIRQESRFNRNAASGAGAIGLMQVLPSTGQALGRRLDVGPVNRSTLTDAETNIRLGTRFLADLFRMYDQRLDLVLAAYNAGPSRADRWRRFPEFAAEDLFVERIPFEETRDYVKIVQTNATIYRTIYEGRTAHR